MNELITIIINVYNGEKYIKKCLDSAVNQTYQNLEILIINDGSTDNTLKICSSYKDKRIRIINQKNIGISLSRNVGIENAKGAYLYFIDSDDFIEHDTIEYLYKLIKEYKLKMATCKALKIYNYKYELKNEQEEVNIIDSKELLKKVLLDNEYAVDIWNKLIERSLFDDLRFEDRIITDMAVIHKLVLKTNKIIHSNQIKYFYLKHPNSITSKKTSSERLIDIYNVSVERFNYIKKIYPEMIENDIGLLQRIIWLSLKDDKKYNEYIKKQKTNIYNDVFSIKVLNYKMGYREKIKIILYRIHPKLNKIIINIYLKLTGKKKK